MAQKFPEIGLRAVFEIAGFMSGYRRYQTVMRDVDKITKQTAQKVTQTGQDMVQKIAQSFTEFARKSSIVRDAMENLTPEASFQEVQRMADAFQNLGDKAQVNVGIFDHLVNSGLSFGQAMQVAGGQVEFSLSAFDRLIQKGVDVDTAFQQASSGAVGASESVTLLGRSFTTTAVAIGAVTAAFKISIALVRKSIDEYTELAEATRNLHFQTGILTKEASSWVQVLQASGSSAATSGRAMSMFLSRVEDMRREQRLSGESTSDFSKALDTLQVDLEDGAGNLKTTEQLLREINVAFQDLGPGAKSTQTAMDLFGRSGRQLLPVLLDQEKSLEDYEATLDRFGATMGALSREEYEEFRRANFQLRASIQGVYNYIASNWIPVLTQVQRIASEVIGIYRTYVEAVFGVEVAQRPLVEQLRRLADWLARVHTNAIQAANAWKAIRNALFPAAAAARALADAEEKAAQKRAQGAAATRDAAEAEEALRKKREEILEQLDELKSQLNQKLSDIDTDAAQAWNDILVQRMRDAFDRSLQNVYRMDDLRRALNEKLDAIDADFKKRWDDILVKRAREAMERAQREIWQDEDLIRRRDRSRADAIRDASDRERKIRRDARKRIEKAEEDARERREKLERDHQRRLQDIRQDFLDTALEAARRNDAVAVARAMRVRARALRDEERRYVDEQSDLEESLKKKREKIEEDRQERESDHRQELQRTLQRIEENHQRQIEEVNRQRDRQRILREQQEQWELDDFNKAKAEQLQAAQDWYDKQLEEIERQQAKEAKLRAIQYERQEIDFVKAWQRRIEDAREWYERERDELATHLDMTGEMLERAYEDWIRAAGEAVTKIVQEISESIAREIERYGHLMNEAQRRAARGVRPPAGQPAPRPPSAPRVPGQPIFGSGPGMAEGGVLQASSPTTVTMGEAGPETAVFMPGRAGSMNVNHNFSRLGVDFQGLPGGMNTQQVQAIVYSVMTQLAKGVQIPR